MFMICDCGNVWMWVCEDVEQKSNQLKWFRVLASINIDWK